MLTAEPVQGDLLDYLDQLDSTRQLDTTPGWQCPHCCSRFERSEAEVAPGHGEPWPPSPIPGACASQKIMLQLVLIRLSPAHKTVAWKKAEDALAMILSAKQAGVSNQLMGRVLTDERLRDWVLLRELLMGTPGASDPRELENQRVLIDRHTEGVFDGIFYRCTTAGVELRIGETTRLIRWRDLPAPGGTT
ncbi:hypothetical protein [Brevibacterium luteolum]|uniref:hypothetical protein n=1 Tax=Brevibacterium luteolum TaxID=199591 RepID=UPI003B6730F9